jgi:hypothetical protein
MTSQNTRNCCAIWVVDGYKLEAGHRCSSGGGGEWVDRMPGQRRIASLMIDETKEISYTRRRECENVIEVEKEICIRNGHV